MSFANKITSGILLLLLSTAEIRAQDFLYRDRYFGFNFSANIAIGSHFQRCGLNLNFFYVNDFFQANTEVRAYFSAKNLGPKRVYPELVLAQGLVFGYDTKRSYLNPFVSSVSNQTSYRHSFGYSYNAYFNTVKTTQQTGIISLQFDRISFLTENDIFARQTLDRFRTGAFLIQYQHEDKFQAAVNCTMWTGKMGRMTNVETDKIYSHCYMDSTAGVYSNLSHGLLSAQFKYNLGLAQNAQIGMGVDAEQVRNAVQNRLIHDARFIPKKWKKRRVCHIPMLDDKGNAYLYQEGQKIKPPSFYWNLFSNPSLFY